MAWQCKSRQVKANNSGPEVKRAHFTRRGVAQQGGAWPGEAEQGYTIGPRTDLIFGADGHGRARRGKAGLGKATRPQVRNLHILRGQAWSGKAMRGVASLGTANNDWPGESGQLFQPQT